MGRLTCELCAGTEFVRETAGFRCHACGCVYTLEQAKRLMQDVPASPAAPASAARKAGAQKLLTAARCARNEGNVREARRCYDLLIAEDPADPEARFYSGFYAVAETPLGGMGGVLEPFLRRLEAIVQDMLRGAGADHMTINSYIRETATLLRSIAELQERMRLELVDKATQGAMLQLQQASNHQQQTYDHEELMKRIAALNRLRSAECVLLWAAYKRWLPGAVSGLGNSARLDTLQMIDTVAAIALKGNQDKDDLATAAMEIEAVMRSIEPAWNGKAMEYLAATMASAEKTGAAGQRNRRFHYLIRAQRDMGWQADYFTRQGWIERRLEAIRLETEELIGPGAEEYRLRELNIQLAGKLQERSKLGMLRFKQKQQVNAEIAALQAQIGQAQELAGKAAQLRAACISELAQEANALAQELDAGI